MLAKETIFLGKRRVPEKEAFLTGRTRQSKFLLDVEESPENLEHSFKGSMIFLVGFLVFLISFIILL